MRLLKFLSIAVVAALVTFSCVYSSALGGPIEQTTQNPQQAGHQQPGQHEPITQTTGSAANFGKVGAESQQQKESGTKQTTSRYLSAVGGYEQVAPVTYQQPQVYEVPSYQQSTYQAPVQTYQPQVSTYQAPVQSYQAPVQSYQTQSYTPQVSTYVQPQTYEQPIVQTYQQPTYSNYSTPSYSAPVYTPVQNYTTPTYQQQTYSTPSYSAPTYQTQSYQTTSYVQPTYSNYSTPSYSPPAYTPPVYSPPVYQNYSTPTYQQQTYVQPTYQQQTYVQPQPYVQQQTYSNYSTPSYQTQSYQAPVTTSYQQPQTYQAPVTTSYVQPTYSNYSTPSYSPPAYTPPVYSPPVYQNYSTPTYQQQTYVQPTYQQPSYQQPSYQAPVYETPIVQNYTAPVYEQPAYVQPTYQQQSYQQPTYQQQSYVQPTYQQQSYQQPTYQQQSYQQPTYQQQTYVQPQPYVQQQQYVAPSYGQGMVKRQLRDANSTTPFHSPIAPPESPSASENDDDDDEMTSASAISTSTVLPPQPVQQQVPQYIKQQVATKPHQYLDIQPEFTQSWADFPHPPGYLPLIFKNSYIYQYQQKALGGQPVGPQNIGYGYVTWSGPINPASFYQPVQPAYYYKTPPLSPFYLLKGPIYQQQTLYQQPQQQIQVSYVKPQIQKYQPQQSVNFIAKGIAKRTLHDAPYQLLVDHLAAAASEAKEIFTNVSSIECPAKPSDYTCPQMLHLSKEELKKKICDYETVLTAELSLVPDTPKAQTRCGAIKVIKQDVKGDDDISLTTDRLAIVMGKECSCHGSAKSGAAATNASSTQVSRDQVYLFMKSAMPSNTKFIMADGANMDLMGSQQITKEEISSLMKQCPSKAIASQ